MKKSTKEPAKKKYNKVSPLDKKIIRKRYEFGENLIELAHQYKINYGTLKNCASKESWEKGKGKELIYLQEQGEDVLSLVKKRKGQKNAFENLLSGTLNGLSEKIIDGKYKIESKSKEEAMKARFQGLQAGYELARSLYDIKSDDEEIEYKTKNLKYERHKLILDKVTIEEEDEEEFKG